jgi:hypothetical protein
MIWRSAGVGMSLLGVRRLARAQIWNNPQPQIQCGTTSGIAGRASAVSSEKPLVLRFPVINESNDEKMACASTFEPINGFHRLKCSQHSLGLVFRNIK